MFGDCFPLWFLVCSCFIIGLFPLSSQKNLFLSQCLKDDNLGLLLCLVISHLLRKAALAEVYQIVAILNDFIAVSGQKINLQKSGLICGASVPINLRHDLSAALNIPLWDTSGKYLRVPAEWGSFRTQALAWIKERVLSKIEGWKEQMLSQAGNEVLIKVAVQAIPSYVMAIVRLPKNFCQSLCSAVANFWWSSKVRSRGIHWKNWNYMCGSKNKGGMGFMDFAVQNSSLLSKQAWRCLKNPNDYWATMLRGIYCDREDVWNVKPKAGISWVWRSLLHGRDLLKQ